MTAYICRRFIPTAAFLLALVFRHNKTSLCVITFKQFDCQNSNYRNKAHAIIMHKLFENNAKLKKSVVGINRRQMYAVMSL